MREADNFRRAGGRLFPLIAVLCLTLSSCGPGADAPPTDTEMLSGLRGFWNEKVPELSRVFHEDFSGSLVPVAAKAVGDGVTETTDMGKTYAVQVAYTFQARGSLTYKCDPNVTTHVQIAVGTQSAYSNLANAGDAFTCSGVVLFTKVDQGWIMNFGSIGTGYLLKR